MLPEILDLRSYPNYSVYGALGPALNRTNKAPALSLRSSLCVLHGGGVRTQHSCGIQTYARAIKTNMSKKTP